MSETVALHDIASTGGQARRFVTLAQLSALLGVGSVPNLSAVLATGNGATGQTITGLGAPVQNGDAATKLYVDTKFAAVPAPSLAAVLAVGRTVNEITIDSNLGTGTSPATIYLQASANNAGCNITLTGGNIANVAANNGGGIKLIGGDGGGGGSITLQSGGASIDSCGRITIKNGVSTGVAESIRLCSDQPIECRGQAEASFQAITVSAVNSGANKVVGARVVNAGLVAVAQTSGAVYTANEQAMLASIKATYNLLLAACVSHGLVATA